MAGVNDYDRVLAEEQLLVLRPGGDVPCQHAEQPGTTVYLYIQSCVLLNQIAHQ